MSKTKKTSASATETTLGQAINDSIKTAAAHMLIDPLIAWLANEKEVECTREEILSLWEVNIKAPKTKEAKKTAGAKVKAVDGAKPPEGRCPVVMTRGKNLGYFCGGKIGENGVKCSSHSKRDTTKTTKAAASKKPSETPKVKDSVPEPEPEGENKSVEEFSGHDNHYWMSDKYVLKSDDGETFTVVGKAKKNGGEITKSITQKEADELQESDVIVPKDLIEKSSGSGKKKAAAESESSASKNIKTVGKDDESDDGIPVGSKH